MFLSDYVAQVQEMLADTTSSTWPQARVIQRLNDARQDAARDMHCVRRNVTGVQFIPGVEIYNLIGAVCGANVTAAGSNYGAGTSVPVTFAAPPSGGVQALGVGNLTGGSLTSITMTQWGQGYNSVPAITVGGAGSGAAATAVTLFQSNPLSTVIGNPLAIVTVSNIWNNERYSLNYLNFTFFQAYARNWVNLTNQGPPGIWTHVLQDTKLYIRRPPDQTYLAELDTVFLTAPLISLSDFDNQVTEPWNTAVQFKACEYLLYKLQNLNQAKNMKALYSEEVPKIITTSGGIRIRNPYHKTVQRRVTGMGG